MAFTYAAQDAITVARSMSHKIPSVDIQAYACDIVFSTIWTKFPWNWTLATLTAITLSDGVQDYALATADAAAFYRFPDWGSLKMVQTNLIPVEYRELRQKNHLGVELTMKGGIDSIRIFSYEGSISKIRLERSVSVPSGATLQLQGEYQTRPAKITANTLSTTLVLPDHYFNVFLSGVRWQLYQLADDPRAGIMKIDEEGRQSYTGQYSVFMNDLFAMQQAEDLSNGEDSAYPDYPLGSPREFTPRIF